MNWKRIWASQGSVLAVMWGENIWTWNPGGGAIWRFILHWHECIGISVLSLACQQSQSEFLAGLPWEWSSIDCKCKLSITDLRNALKIDIIEAVECLHSWLKSGLVGGLRTDIEALREEIMAEIENGVVESELGGEFSGEAYVSDWGVWYVDEFSCFENTVSWAGNASTHVST